MWDWRIAKFIMSSPMQMLNNSLSTNESSWAVSHLQCTLLFLLKCLAKREAGKCQHWLSIGDVITNKIIHDICLLLQLTESIIKVMHMILLWRDYSWQRGKIARAMRWGLYTANADGWQFTASCASGKMCLLVKGCLLLCNKALYSIYFNNNMLSSFAWSLEEMPPITL